MGIKKLPTLLPTLGTLFGAELGREFGRIVRRRKDAELSRACLELIVAQNKLYDYEMKLNRVAAAVESRPKKTARTGRV